MQISSTGFGDGDLSDFRDAQRRSFSILGEVASRLEAGWSERAAVKVLFEAFADHGVDRFFHVPVALFGRRTALPEPWDLVSFGPTRSRLEPGTPVILDASPLIGDFLVDTSYSWSFGENESHRALLRRNLAFRDAILAAVRAGQSMQQIAADVDAQLRRERLTNCHRLHPEAVLGHRALKVEGDTSTAPADGFHPAILAWFRREIANGELEIGRSPTWNDRASSDQRVPPGLWAVEPHIAEGDVGVKWEELLVVHDDGTADWLDNEVPHLAHAGV